MGDSKKDRKVSVRAAERGNSQLDRFKRMSRELGCDEDEASFDEALGKVASSPPPKSVEKRKTKKPAK